MSANASMDCILAFDVITNFYAQFARSIFMILQIIQIVAFFLLAAEFRRTKMPMHGNLKLLYIHLVIVCLFAPIGYPMAEIRNILLAIVHREWDCSMQTPIWYILISRGPILLYTYAIPFLHFAIMLERYRATKLAENYELSGTHFGMITLAIIYLLAFSMTFCILGPFLSDNNFSLAKSLPFNTALSKSNGQFAQFFTFFQTLLVIFTVIGDYWVFKMNKKLRRERIKLNYVANIQRISSTYNLSRNYQLHENYTAMKLILPLDITFMFSILIFNILVFILRSYQSTMSTAVFLAHYNLLSCLLSIYAILSFIIYRYFLLFGLDGKRGINHKNGTILPIERIGQLYFEQLKKQWELPGGRINE